MTALISLLIIVIIYPKFPLIGVTGSFVSVRLEDILIATVFGFWTIKKITQKRFPLAPIHKSLLIYLGIAASATIAGILLTKTVMLQTGVLHWARRVEYMGLFWVAYDSLKEKLQINSILKTLLVISLAVSIFGLGQQFLKFPVISTTNSEFSKGLALDLGPGARINSTFAGHYDLAAFCVLPLMICLGLFFGQSKNKVIYLLVGGAIYWVMLLSASRVTFVATYVVACLYLVILKKRKWIVSLGILAILSILVSPQLAGRYRQLLINYLSVAPVIQTVHAQTSMPVDKQTPTALENVRQEDRSLNIRLEASWPKALRAVEKNPLFGTGLSSIGLAIDNDYLRLLGETGILGTVAFLLIFIRIYKSSLKVLKQNQQQSETIFSISILLFVLSLLMNAVFIDIFEASKIAIVLWILLGLQQKLLTLDK